MIYESIENIKTQQEYLEKTIKWTRDEIVKYVSAIVGELGYVGAMINNKPVILTRDRDYKVVVLDRIGGKGYSLESVDIEEALKLAYELHDRHLVMEYDEEEHPGNEGAIAQTKKEA